MDDTKKKLLFAGLGTLVLGAGSYLAFSGSAENVAPDPMEKVAVQPEEIPAAPQATEGKRTRPGKSTAYQNGEKPTRRTTISTSKKPDKPTRGGRRGGDRKIKKTPLPPGA